MDYRFFLNDLSVPEPIGWQDFELSLKRDDVFHGMQFTVSTGSLRFYGIAATYLIEQKTQNRLQSNVTFTAQTDCGNEEFETIISGRLNFGKYKAFCGKLCVVEIPFEEEGCKIVFKSRFDQKVDLDNIMALDNATLLPDYAQLGQLIEVPAKALQSAVQGDVAADGYENGVEFSVPIGITGSTTFLRPDYSVERYNNIATGQLIGINNCITNNTIAADGCDGPITPQLLFEDDLTCFDGNFNYTSRKKGTITISGNTSVVTIKHKILTWDAVGDIFTDSSVDLEDIIFTGDPTEAPLTIPFDSTITGSEVLPSGIGFYAVIEVAMTLMFGDSSITINYDPETTIDISAVKLCPPTNVQYYMVHEALSRITESITNRCMRVKSEYYGRIDSQPFAFDVDGCGGLRMLTSGLKLRNAPDGKFFASAKDLLEGLRAIDNIGFDIAPDPEIAGRFILRVEPADFFYQDEQILFLDNISESVNEIQESMHYAKINAGYEKWEVEEVNGLNEFNSGREYRTNIETISTALDIRSKLVAGSYPIEITRQQSFAESGAADTTFDNEAFIICLNRLAYSFEVEQGEILSAENIFDPGTVFNFRISPIRNLMRWFKSIINSYPGIGSGASRLFFNAGSGNFLASGLLDDATECRLENAAIAENASIGATNFTDQTKATPLWQNETDSFEYPLSVSQFNALKTNPYGYIATTCGGSPEVVKGFIKEVKFRPARGMGSYTLTRKWEQ